MREDMSDEREIVFSANPETRRMELWEPGPSPVMTIHHDGRVVFGAHLTPNEAGKAVVRILDDLANRHAARIAELEAAPTLHEYHPSIIHRGDCSVCGHIADSPRHIDYVRRLEAALAARDAEVMRLREAARKTVAADNLREQYYKMPNDKNRIGDPKSPKSRAKTIWLRASRRAAIFARAALNPGDPDDQ